MRIPVIIPACNEAALLGRTLERLDQRIVEPIVVANGCQDDTVLVTKSFGLEPIVEAEPGKLPAIQAGLKWLNSRALETVLYTDADSFPLRNAGWLKAMGQSTTAAPGPHISFGPIAYVDTHSHLDNLARSAKRQLDARRSRAAGTPLTIGINMATRLQRLSALEAILDLPHVWPGEDRLMSEIIVEQGGACQQVVSPWATVATSSRSKPPFFTVVRQDHNEAWEQTLADYRQRAAPGSITYTMYCQLHPSPQAAEPIVWYTNANDFS